MFTPLTVLAIKHWHVNFSPLTDVDAFLCFDLIGHHRCLWEFNVF